MMEIAISGAHKLFKKIDLFSAICRSSLNFREKERESGYRDDDRKEGLMK
jgi:hypothetical protein